MTSLLPHITLDTAPNPTHSIIWLHGLGADGEDFVPIANELQLSAAVRYIFPHAPMRPVTLNGGYVMRAWYDILISAASAELSANLTRQEDAIGIHDSQMEIEKLIAQEKNRGIAAEHIFLAGFSQGGAVVLHTGLRHAEKLGGILALSTYLPLANTASTETNKSARSTPIFMAHGRSDPVIPLAFGSTSATKLSQLGFEMEWHEYNMPHSVCPEELRDIEDWLSRKITG